jgi:hypothetical protein
MEPTAIHVGVDLGQRVDPSAIAVVEVGQRDTDRTEVGYRPHPATGELIYNTWTVEETFYRTHHLERLPLNTSYRDVAWHIVALLTTLSDRELAMRLSGAWTHGRIGRALYLDATGVGIPVAEDVRALVQTDEKASQWDVYPLTFTHGLTYDRSAGRLGKAYLVSHLQTMLQSDRIDLPKSDPEVEAMVRELKDYDITISQDGADTYGAKIGSYDDLATALGLATLDDPASYQARYIPFHAPGHYQ